MLVSVAKDSALLQLTWDRHGDDYLLVLPPEFVNRILFPQEKPRLRNRVIVDFSWVKNLGLRTLALWFDWCRELDPKTQFVFRNCSPEVIDLMNFKDGFQPADVIVESFAAPYECLICGHKTNEVYLRGKHYLESNADRPAQIRFPFELNCDQCPGMMELAVIENIYLRFLNPHNETKV
jgi:hypothetical protein